MFQLHAQSVIQSICTNVPSTCYTHPQLKDKVVNRKFKCPKV